MFKKKLLGGPNQTLKRRLELSRKLRENREAKFQSAFNKIAPKHTKLELMRRTSPLLIMDEINEVLDKRTSKAKLLLARRAQRKKKK